jgi:hypothetical protein
MYFLYLVASYSAQSFTVAGIFLFATKSRPALRHNQPAYRKADNSSPYSVCVKNVWKFPSISTYVFKT